MIKEKKFVFYRYEVDNISKDLRLCNITSAIQDFNDIRSDNTLPVLCDELNMNNKMEAMVNIYNYIYIYIYIIYIYIYNYIDA